MDTLSAGLVQMASGSDWIENLSRVRGFVKQLAGRCDLVVFPENVLCLGKGNTIKRAAKAISAICDELGQVAKDHACAIVFGGVPVQEDKKLKNASLVFAADGSLIARYDKMHLFQLDPNGANPVDETRVYVPGNAPVAFDFNGWRIGLSICYDLRFPELFRTYVPVDLMLCTAAFTAETGRAHWEVLLRARAIENLCYVAGVGQCGGNPETGMQLHGHSMAVAPWGQIVSEADAHDEQFFIVELKKSALSKARQRLPAL